MTDFNWERYGAGHYETPFFINGYRYKVTGEGVSWDCFYMFRTKNPKLRVWKSLPGGWSDRMKNAKRMCEEHNRLPRRKFTIKGRELRKMYITGQGWVKDVPHIVFQEMYEYNGEWKARGFHHKARKLPDFYESYSGEVTYLGDDYLFGRESVLTGENRYRLSDGSLVTPKFVEETNAH